MKDKVCIVTGGSRGIGRAIANELAARGAKVLLTYLKSSDAAFDLVSDIKKAGGRAEAVMSDSRDYGQARNVVGKALDLFGGLDVLVNNAGIIKDKAIMLMEPDEWKDVIDTNLTGYFNMAKACIVTMLKQKSGNIINISSVAGVVGTPRQTNYASAKAGIIGLTKSLAKEVAAYNIRVNAVAPGYIETDMTRSLNKTASLLKMIPSGRLGKPEEVAKVVSFLADDRSGYITGQVIKVDGGLAI